MVTCNGACGWCKFGLNNC